MNKYKLIIILLIGTVSGILLCNCTKENEEEFPANISFPEIDLSASGQIPTLAWYSISGPHTTLNNYRDLKEAGFTHNLSFPAGEQDIENSFGYATQAGLKILLYVDRTWTSEEEMNARVQRYKNHPALFGYYVYDEPSPGQFPEVAETVKFIQGLDRQHPCYVNMYPNIQNPFYREYVDNFIKTVPVPFLSFDHYPVMGRDDVSPVRHLRPEWYENLEIISKASRKAGKPFWAFALATAHTIKIGNDPVSVYPIPTLTDLRLQIYSNLAYGAQGIQYFTYFTPTGEGDTFHDGPFYKGNKTKTYYTVKEMNAEIKALSGVFLHSRVKNVYHTGLPVPKGTKKLRWWHLPSAIRRLATSGEGAVVSFLEKEQKDYMVVVNRNLMNSMELNLMVNNKSKVRRVFKDGTVSGESLSGYNSFDIDKGDAAIFVWTK